MPTPGGLKGIRSLVTKSCRTEFRSEKTGNKMVKSQVLRIRNMCSVASCFDRNISLFALNPMPLATLKSSRGLGRVVNFIQFIN